MIKNMTGDIFTSTAEALVNPVNCVGHMGEGLALEFKKRFKRNFEMYRVWCNSGYASPGRINMCLTSRPGEEDVEPILIFNFPTKAHLRDSSKVNDIERGLKELALISGWMKVSSIAMPLLGCGLGGLKETDVVPLIERFAESLPHVTVELWRIETR